MLWLPFALAALVLPQAAPRPAPDPAPPAATATPPDVFEPTSG